MKPQTKHFYQFDPFCLDLAEGLLMRGEEHIPLTPKAFETLLVLVENAGHVIEKESLLNRVWPDTFVEEVNLAKNISYLRKILGGRRSNQYIETIPKRGYRFVAEVLEVWDRPQAEGHDAETAVAVPSETNNAGGSPDPVPAAMLQEDPSGAGPRSPSPPIPRNRLIWPASILALGIVLAAVWFSLPALKVSSGQPTLMIVPFTSFPGRESQPAFSPDGARVAFLWDGEKGDNPNVYVKETGNGKMWPLTADAAAKSSPAWSPDGRYVAFWRQSADHAAWCLEPVAGGSEREIATVSHDRRPPLGNSQYYSPDGQFLAVSDSSSLDEPLSIYFLKIERGGRQKITSPPAGTAGDSYPAFSPDGKTLAFLRTTSLATTDIHLLSLGGGQVRRLTFDNASIVGLAWTPDGREIVFSSRRGSSIHSLWRVGVAGGQPERLAAASGQSAFSPAISPKGFRLAYMQALDDLNIWGLEIDGSGRGANPRRVVSSTYNDNGPDFSPDGRRIVFASSRTGGFGIWVCDQDGANPELLVDRGPYLTGTPRWSPDGSRIAFDSRSAEAGEEGNADIYVVGLRDRTQRRLTSGATENVAPSWSRDGKWIYFGSTRSGGMQIWKVPAEGGPAVRVTQNGGFEGFESGDGKYFYYSKGRGIAGIWRIPTGGGEEELLLDTHRAGYWRLWTVAEHGIYFATAVEPSSPAIEFYSFSTGKVTPVAALDKPLSRSDPGLCISRDGRRLLFTQLDQSGCDIMLADNFR